MLEELGLSAIRDRHPYTLSGGQRQRLALASILVHKPAVLIADEPTAALNWQDATEILELLALFNKDGGTVVIITHDLDLLWQVTDRVAVLGEGKVVGLGSMVELSQMDHPIIREYFDGPRGRAAQEQAQKLNKG